MIRIATPQDVESITAIYNECIAEGGYTGDLDPLSVENRQTWFTGHRAPYRVFVKEVAGTVVGYLALSSYRKGRRAFSGTCEINYYLSTHHRGTGIGKELISHAIEYARQTGFSLLVAVILASNERSINLLRKFGFSISGRLPHAAKINGKYIDHVYLSRSWTNAG